MANKDFCDEIAAIVHPLPAREQVHAADVYDEVCLEIERERETTAAELRTLWEVRDEGGDPLLSSLARLYRERVEAEAGIRRLLAYAREFTRPKPYPLTDLADAAGMSFSGVRTAYSQSEVDFVAEQIGRRPRTERSDAAPRPSPERARP
jgi:hypothetical protein